jgi:hypothetical protein
MPPRRRVPVHPSVRPSRYTNKTIKNAKTDCKKTENKFKKKKKNIYISNELMHIIALILILEI